MEPQLSPRAVVALQISVAPLHERTLCLEDPSLHPFFISFQELPITQKVKMS